ncbi:MAG: ribosome recycling factor [Bacteroidetes bacterium HGW-Bacteroidetes-6]|jgi:ribosome recycling factor|nr:MAG: ribosome recycling factor [Bacteroidetes bacterium HGW-Bacteroidetes-6]
MTDDSLLLLEETKEGMMNAVAHLERELVKIRAGKASPAVFDGVKIDFYGTMTPLAQVGNINIPDAKTIVIQPWDRSVLGAVEKAIMAANLGFTPVNNGEIIRISIPPLTEERRKDMVKKVKAEGESAKIAVRNVRRNVLEKAKKLTKEGVPEDEVKNLEKDIQTITDKHIESIDKILAEKEKDIMTV